MSLLSTLSVVVPAYNEATNLTCAVLAAQEVLQDRISQPVEWLLVDDGSTDTTWTEIIELAVAIPNVVPLRHATNRGLGAAVWTGMCHASTEWCVWMPADGQVPPQAIADMVALADDADIVLLMRQWDRRPWPRRALTFLLYGLIRLVLGYDPEGYSGVYLVRRQILQHMRLLASTGVQNFVVVLHCRRNGYRIRQTGTVIQSRISGKSKVVNLPTMLKSCYDIVKFRLAS